MQKYIYLFAIFFMGITPSLKAVEKIDNDLEKIDTASQIMRNLETYCNRGFLLISALKCSVLENGRLKEEERIKFREEIDKDIIKGRKIGYRGTFNINDMPLYEGFLNRLQKLDAKDIIDYILKSLSYPEIYYRAREFIPLALHWGKTDAANYFYEKVNEDISKTDRISLEEENLFKVRLIQYATQYFDYDAIIQFLSDKPYSINQEDVDCAFWMGFASIDNDHLFSSGNRFRFSFDEICRLFLNNTIRPSVKILEDLEYIWSNVLWNINMPYTPIISLLRLFSARHTPEEQRNFDFNAAFEKLEKLSANVQKFPELKKILTLIHNDYMKGDIPIDRKKFPSTQALDDYKVTRLVNGEPMMQRAATHEANIASGSTGLLLPQLANKIRSKNLKQQQYTKDLKFNGKVYDLNRNDLKKNNAQHHILATIAEFSNHSTQHLSKMSDKGKKWIEERDKLMAEKEDEEKIKKQMDAETNGNTHQQIETVAPNQNNDAVQINTMQADNSAEDSNNKGASCGKKVSKKDPFEI